MYSIYVHINKANNKAYVGQTKQKPERRWRTNGKGYIDSPLFYKPIQKYGWDNFEHIILEECPNANSANEREIYWIQYFNSFDNGYNLTPGGNNYMGELWKNLEFKEKMKKSFSIKAQKEWADSKRAEVKQKKMQEGIQRVWSDENWRKKRIEKIIGEKNPNSKKVVNLETGKIFSTIKEASEWADLKSVSSIGQCCKGKRKTAGVHSVTKERLTWSFVEGGDQV